MSFLTPLFLFGAFALAAPLIYHLIRRTTRERTIFSSLMFLLPSPPRLSRKNRLEDILLLILRCLALALLAFGFSRPFFRNTTVLDAPSAQNRRVVVVLDHSASMRRAGLWADARDRVAAVIRSATPGDQMAVYLFSNQPTPLVTFEEWQAAPVSGRTDLVVSRLAASSPDYGSTHLGKALIEAADALTDVAGKDPAVGIRQIVLVSDIQSGSELDSLQSYDWPKGIQLRVEAVKARNPTNAGLQLLVEAPDAGGSTAGSMRLRVTNSADSMREGFQVGWTRPGVADFVGKPVDIYVPPGQSRVLTLPVPEGQADLQQISLRGDDEDFDNLVYAVPPEKQQVPLAYIGRDQPEQSSQPLYFLKFALTAREDPRLAFPLTVRTPETIAGPEVQNAKVIFVTDLPAGPAATALRQLMLAGKTVVFAPKSADAAAGLAQLLGLPSVSMEELSPGPAPGERTSSASGYEMIGQIDFSHPLFSPFADPRFSDFTKIHVWRYRRLGADKIPGARVLASFDHGDPAVVEVPAASGRLIMMLTGFGRDDSDLVRSTKFPQLIISLLDLGGAIPAQAVQYDVNAPIPLALVAPAGEAVTVTPPGGAPQAMAAGATAFSQTREPGIYRLATATRTARVSVNLDAAESRTSPMAADLLERYGAPGAGQVVDPARKARQEALLQGAEAEGRQKLWRWFIGATLVVLLIESAIAGWTARRNSATVSTGGITS